MDENYEVVFHVGTEIESTEIEIEVEPAYEHSLRQYVDDPLVYMAGRRRRPGTTVKPAASETIADLMAGDSPTVIKDLISIDEISNAVVDVMTSDDPNPRMLTVHSDMVEDAIRVACDQAAIIVDSDSTSNPAVFIARVVD